MEIVSGEFSELLTSGEEVVMSDSASISGNVGKLVLTNKRLLFCSVKGFFNRKMIVEMEVALSDIANVVGDIGKTSMLTGVTGNSWLIIKPKVGEEWRFGFSGVDSMALWNFDVAQTQAMNKVSSWVNSLKLELLKIAQTRG